jgi:hypothetical protein
MSSNYSPDNWVVIFLNGDAPHYRILAGWSGGYLNGDSWRMNSGIVKCEEVTEKYTYNGKERESTYYVFYGSSGSYYKCHKDTYCLRMNNAHVWKQLQDAHGDKVSLMDEDTDWLEMEWLIS